MTLGWELHQGGKTEKSAGSGGSSDQKATTKGEKKTKKELQRTKRARDQQQQDAEIEEQLHSTDILVVPSTPMMATSAAGGNARGSTTTTEPPLIAQDIGGGGDGGDHSIPARAKVQRPPLPFKHSLLSSAFAESEINKEQKPYQTTVVFSSSAAVVDINLPKAVERFIIKGFLAEYNSDGGEEEDIVKGSSTNAVLCSVSDTSSSIEERKQQRPFVLATLPLEGTGCVVVNATVPYQVSPVMRYPLHGEVESVLMKKGKIGGRPSSSPFTYSLRLRFEEQQHMQRQEEGNTANTQLGRLRQITVLGSYSIIQEVQHDQFGLGEMSWMQNLGAKNNNNKKKKGSKVGAEENVKKTPWAEVIATTTPPANNNSVSYAQPSYALQQEEKEEEEGVCAGTQGSSSVATIKGEGHNSSDCTFTTTTTILLAEDKAEKAEDLATGGGGLGRTTAATVVPSYDVYVDEDECAPELIPIYVPGGDDES